MTVLLYKRRNLTSWNTFHVGEYSIDVIFAYARMVSRGRFEVDLGFFCLNSLRKVKYPIARFIANLLKIIQKLPSLNVKWIENRVDSSPSLTRGQC